MSDFLMKPKIDFAFKEIMENEKARTGFLAAVLQLDPKDIKETRILNSNLRVTVQHPVKGTLIFGQNRENKISVSSLL